MELWLGRSQSFPFEVGLGLAPGKWRAFSVLRGLPLELTRADEAERRMPADGIVEAVDVSADGGCCLGAALENGAPDEYPSWSRAVRQPIAPLSQQAVCENYDAPHDGGNGDLLRLAGLEQLLILAVKIPVKADGDKRRHIDRAPNG